ncbi:MAG: hypothetical protein IPJ07_17185 [Acidobacteria bacterium]|nr:hypothetical protein [Acidobacteriota bacterium]
MRSKKGIYLHPAVAEAAVFGIPDAVYGEALMATIVLKPGQSLTEEEIRKHISGYVTKFKVPDRIVFLRFPSQEPFRKDPQADAEREQYSV